MKILLIYPYCLEKRIREDDVSVVPIGVYYIAALLKENNYDVEILNWYNINKRPEEISKTLKEKHPDVVAFSVLHANRWGAIEISRIAKQINPETTVIFGGVGATFLWEHFLSHFDVVDFVVVGEGEYTFLELIDWLAGKKRGEVAKIKGLAFRKEGKPFKTEPRAFISDLDQLPHPAKYFTYQHVISTRGCPWDCTFCGSPQIWKRRVRYHSPEYFVRELELLWKRGVRFFFVSDDTFTIKKDRVIEICRLIIRKQLNISWVAISRVNYVDEEIVSWLRKAGCIQISYGVESGSEKIRSVLKKRVRTRDIKQAFALSTKYGILPRAYFIYGSPGETWETIEESVTLINEIKPLGIIFYILDIFPGTKLYEDLKRGSGLSDDVWLQKIEDIMYFETDPGMSKEMILAFGEKLRSEYYSRIASFVDSIELIGRREFYPLHAEFLSRLAMTFSHGDYSQNELIVGGDAIAERLYKRSLKYFDTPRAYLGLAMLQQKRRVFNASIETLTRGLEIFPDNDRLKLCMAVSLMNLGRFTHALEYLHKCEENSDIVYYIASCYRALGDREKEREYMKKAH